MTVLVQAIDRAFEIRFNFETLKPVAMFCGAGLAVSLLFASYGLDLSAGFF